MRFNTLYNKSILIIPVIIVGILLALFVPQLASAQNSNGWQDGNPPPSQYHTAKVLEISDSTIPPDYSDGFSYEQPSKIKLKLLSGDNKGQTIETEMNIIAGQNTIKLGDVVVIEEIYRVDGTTIYMIGDNYRIDSLWIVFGIFLLLLIIFSGWRGASSLAGLIFSVLVLALFTVPQIVAGQNPLIISIVSAFIIALVSIYLSHGFNKRTTIAVIGTCITIVLAIALAYVSTTITGLTGMGSEAVFQLSSWGPLSEIDFRGLLLGGIIIGALGVLDDVTTAQSAAIDEISKANPSLSSKELYKRGFSVGKEHITSLVNTLALAYVGASFPLLLIFVANPKPIWTIVNSQMVSEEIIRTLVGSMALILAVPITTAMAAYWFSKRIKTK